MRALVAGIMLIAATPSAAQMSPPVPKPPPENCSAPEHAQFDFWVGRWDVYKTGMEELVARSRIEKIFFGCAIQETWKPFSLIEGGSLSNYVAEEKAWRQTWLDAQNARVDFKGGLEGDRMILTGFWKGINGPGKDALIRMTFSRESKGNVRQLGEASSDGGRSWSPSFDFTYKPAR